MFLASLNRLNLFPGGSIIQGSSVTFLTFCWDGADLRHKARIKFKEQPLRLAIYEQPIIQCKYETLEKQI